MAIYQRKLNSSNSEIITIWENGVTDTFKTFTVVGNKADGVGSHTLVKLPPDIPTNCVINSATIRMPERNYEGYWGPAAITAKISRLSGAWNGSPTWASMPAHDTDVYGTEVFDNAAPHNGTLDVDYNYRTGYHAAKWKYKCTETGEYHYELSYLGTSYNDGFYHYTYVSYTAAYYDTYILYHNVDIKDVMQRVISSGGSGLMVWYDLPGANDSRKYFMTPLTTDDALQWELIIDYTSVPAPTPPGIGTIGTVTDSPHTFGLTAAEDTSGNFTPEQLYYAAKISFNNGATYSDEVESAQGDPEASLDIKTLLGIAAGQYYYNAACKISVRTKTPNYGGMPYYSEPVVSPAFVIDYRLAPSAPGLTPSKAAPYEGETITFTCARPATYNTHTEDGSANALDYHVELATGVALVNGGAAVSATEKALAYTVGNLTSGMADLSANIRARCIDGEGQVGAYCANVAFTVKRFRAPVLNIATVERTADATASVAIVVQDTGYGAVQTGDQISKVQYKIDGGAWADVVLGAWSSLSNTFDISGLAAGRHTLSVRAANVAPDGTALAAITGDADSVTLLEYSPVFFKYRNSTTGVSGVKAKSLVVSDDFSDTVPQEGDGYIEKVLNVGQDIKISGLALSDLYLGKTAQSADAEKLGGVLPAGFSSVGSIANGDMNYAVTSGMYRLGVPTNGPGINYGQLIVSHGPGDTVLQIVSDYLSGSLFWRSGNPPQAGGTGSWGAWRKLCHDGNFQIRTGQCTLNTSSWVSVSFASPLPGVPRITFGPASTTSGVLAPKHRNASASGFEAVLGGSGLSGIVVDYTAVYLA